MASNPLKIVSVEEFKTATRFTGDTSHDTLIETHILAAAGFVDEMTACGMIDRDIEYLKTGQQQMDPIYIPLRCNARLTDIFYCYPPDHHAKQMLMTDSVTKRVGAIEINPPEAGWRFSEIRITGTMSIPVGSVPPVLKSAIILLAKRLYDGEDVDKGDWAVSSLIRPYRSERKAAPGLELSTHQMSD